MDTLILNCKYLKAQLVLHAYENRSLNYLKEDNQHGRKNITRIQNSKQKTVKEYNMMEQKSNMKEFNLDTYNANVIAVIKPSANLHTAASMY